MVPMINEVDNVTELPLAKRREVRRPPRTRERVRMSGQERREQLLDVGRKLFAEKGFDAVTVEEIAAKADVSKPVVYEHFGGKEGLYAVVVDREMNHLLATISDTLTSGNARVLVEQAALALFDYIDEYPDGFRILVRDSPVSQQTGSFASLIIDVAAQVEHLLAAEFAAHRINTKLAPMYSQMLVGMVALTGQWWLDVRKPKKDEVVAHLVNLAWSGLENLDAKPRLITKRDR
jgi:AcrR family transcriptional regulator